MINRGIEVPPDIKKLFEERKTKTWPVDTRGYFVKGNGKRYNPSPVQASFVASTARYSSFWGPRGCGKALDVNTPIPTPTGWTRMGDICPGDYVFGDDGNPVEVLSVSPVMYGHTCYDVVFDDGSVVTADAEHEWVTLTSRDRSNKDSVGKNRTKRGKIVPRHASKWSYRKVTTEDIKKTITTGYRNDVNHSIDLAAPANLPDADFSIPPYVLGLWLGDGTSSSSSITIGNQDIEEQRKILADFGISLKNHGQNAYGMVMNGEVSTRRNVNSGRVESNPDSLYSMLKRHDLIKNKHIPQEYLRGSYSQRLELLQGLMDSDGHIQSSGSCEFCNTNISIVAGLYELCMSLGIKTSICHDKILFNNKYFDRWRVFFVPYIPVFKLPRKLAKIKERGNQSNRRFRRYVVEVRETASVPVRCITVNSDSHLYLAGTSWIPTHNSGAGAQRVLAKLAKGESGAVMNPDMENFKLSTWPELKEWLPWEMVVPSQRHRRRAEWEPTKPFTMVFMNGAKLYCKGLKDPDSARGPNINFLWYDEAGRDKTGQGWKIAISSVRIGENPQAFATFTPKNSEHWTTKFFVKKEIPDEVKQQFAQAIGDDKILIEDFHATREDNKENLDPAFYVGILAANPSGWLKAQEYDGEVADEGGQIGYASWFDKHIVTSLPEKIIKKVRAWDTAASEKKTAKDDPDESVGTLIAKFKPSENPEWLALHRHLIPEGLEKQVHFIIENQVSGWWTWEKLLEVIKNAARHDGPFVEVCVDQDPGGAGKNQIAMIVSAFKDTRNPELNAYTVREVDVRRVGDRVLAANTHWFGVASEGRMWLYRGSWNDGFLAQVDGFTMISHDDKVTSTTSAMFVLNPARRWSKTPFLSI